jgi:hypothetical protein
MGTEEFWVPAVLALASAGTQYANTSAANSRQDSAEAQSIADQQAIREKGNQQVQQTVKQVAGDNPQALAAQAQSKYIQTLRQNAAGSTQGGSTTNPALFGASTSALPPGTVGSKAYKADTANSQQQVQSYGNTEATEMGDLDAAVRERQNEGLQLQTLNTGLNTLGAESYGTNFVDQLRAQTQGQLNPWASLFSSLAGNAGSTLSKNPQLLGGSPGLSAGAVQNAGSNPYVNATGGYLQNNPAYQGP